MQVYKKQSETMNLKKFISYLNVRQSLKEIELNKILDKISKKIKLSPSEKDFLGHYDQVKDDDIKDFNLLTCQTTFEKINHLISKQKLIICNLSDRNGIINLPIHQVFCNYESEEYFLILKNNEEIKLKDNFFYNIIYILDKNHYSLETEDEFYEKIGVKNED
jgi:hypothetical protein